MENAQERESDLKAFDQGRGNLKRTFMKALKLQHLTLLELVLYKELRSVVYFERLELFSETDVKKKYVKKTRVANNK